METKIEIFEFIVHRLKDWFMEKNSISSLEDFNRKNDFSVLKLIKLHFLVSTIDSAKNDALLNQFTFYAMPYGPVETVIYNRIKSNPIFSSFSVDNFKSNFINNDYQSEWNDSDLIDIIDKSIAKLKDIDDNLINADAGSLVEVTHKWNSWKMTYSQARDLGQYSKQIDNDLIKNDNKYLKD
ncbi:MAG TPA: DUF4065 domain-containing protein, partial [Flavobacterium sp.]|nr:DUF4065 domain-containing protein [Flavobacterium sp.]